MYPDLFFAPLFLAFISAELIGSLVLLVVLSLLYFRYRKRSNNQAEAASGEDRSIEKSPVTPFEILYNALFGFVLGYKGIYAILNFSAFQMDPTGVVLSSTGHWVGGIIGAMLFIASIYWEKSQQ